MSSDVLMQQWVEPAQEEPYGRRILQDGTVEEHSSVTASFVDGELVYESQPAEWRQLGHCEPEIQRMLEDAIRESGVLEMPAKPSLPGTTVAKARLIWTVALDGRSNELQLTDAHLLSDPRLAAVDEAFQLAFAHSTAAR
jgi:hypothetical protein